MHKKIILWVTVLLILALTVYIFCAVYLNNSFPTAVVDKLGSSNKSINKPVAENDQKTKKEKNLLLELGSLDTWSKYQSEKYGFEIIYPASWEVRSKEIPEPDSIGLRPMGETHFAFIKIRTHVNSSNLSIENYFNFDYYDQGGFQADSRAFQYSFFEELAPENLIVADKPSFFFENENYSTVLLTCNDKIYEITRLKGEIFDKFVTEEVFNLMLNNFEFIDKELESEVDLNEDEEENEEEYFEEYVRELKGVMILN